MALITKYGALWGAIPNTAGRVFWVAPTSPYLVDGRSYDASDDHDGLSPERAVATINRAATALATANAGDVIVLLPGSHVLSAAVTASTAGITFMGLPSGAGNKMRQKTVVQASASAACFAITAADVEIAYLHCLPTTANSAITISADGDRAHIHHCSFNMFTPVASTSTLGINATGGAENVFIEQCVFISAGAQGAAVDITGFTDSIVQDCDFISQSGVWAAAMTVGAATTRCVVKRCSFNPVGTTATMTSGIDGSGADIAGGLMIEDCRFAPTTNVLTAVNRFTATTAYVVESYQGVINATTSVNSSLILLID